LIDEPHGRLTDDYVDCAEFIYDVSKQIDVTIPSGNCDMQYSSLTTQGYPSGTTVAEIKKGDIIFWTSPNDSKVLAHTGIATQDYNNSYIPVVQSGRSGCECDKLKYPVYEIDNDTKDPLTDADGNKKVKYATISDCDQACINASLFSIRELTNYVNSEGTAINSKGNIDLKFKYWVRPKK